MNPAPSVIVFTVASGLGFGLLAWLGIGLPPVTGWAAFAMFFLGFALAVGGLLASAFHLGNPRRALLAFSQWRSSWLSREAWLSVAALIASGLYALDVMLFGNRIAGLGWAAAALSLAAVAATSMIYSQLKTVPRWNQPLTPVLFVTFALAGGAILAAQTLAAVVLLAALGVVMMAHWMIGDGRFAASGVSMGTATGLGFIGTLRQVAPPHSGRNYLLREMVFRVGRKHAMKLRAIAIALTVVAPIAALLVLPAGVIATGIAALSYLAGALAARWLFFAEAEHVVGLYYGKH